MEKNGSKMSLGQLACWFGTVVHLLLLAQSSPARSNPRSGATSQKPTSSPPVHLRRLDHHVVMDNGIVNVTLSIPKGMITRIQYDGVDNLLEYNKASNRGYWDIVWSTPNSKNVFDQLEGTSFRIIMEEEHQVELSFIRKWNPSLNASQIPALNIDKRFIMLRGYAGFYSYAIMERSEGWPDLNIEQARIAFKLRKKLFHYMAVSDSRQRVMPTDEDRTNGRALEYREAVLLTNPANPRLKGEVDDKYQYSSDVKDNRLHGWISRNPPVGFWVITPSDEFRVGGPLKQELTSHVGPTSLAMFFSGHYAGSALGLKFRNGEAWKKVFGPVSIYLNSISTNDDPLSLWKDAKQQMLKETENWPYDFALSEDYPHDHQRGRVQRQRSSAFVGLAPPGEVGSWQTENKGYQFWTPTDENGSFLIKNVRYGNYNLFAWVPGFIGDYKYGRNVSVTQVDVGELGDIVYHPPRRGPTLWEIGIPDRTAAEFYIPDPNPTLINRLYINHTDKFRQYGLWDRYTDLYPAKDLIYTVGASNYQTDWFFAHVNRINVGNRTYDPTTWQIVFDLQNVNTVENYTLQLALASATAAELQVRINDDPSAAAPLFSTGLIGRDNSIARHGIHGLYWLYAVDIPAFRLVNGSNTIFLTQSRGSNPFTGIMYDYIRLEAPPN